MRFLLYLILISIFVSCSSTKKATNNNDLQKTDGQEIKTSASKKVKHIEKLPSSQILKNHVQVTPLITQWHHQIDKEKIEALYLKGDLLIAATKSTYLYAFNRETGLPVWVYKIGHSIDYPPTRYEDKLFVLSMGTLHVISTITGGQLLKKDLSFVPCAPACATDRYVYIPSWDKFVYAVDPETGNHDWRFRTDDHVLSQPVEMDGSLYFATIDNFVYSISAQTGNRLEEWATKGKFQTFGANKANLSILESPPTVFVGSRDYNLYGINRITGVTNWKFESGGEINNKALSIGNTIYAISQRKAGKTSILHSLDAKSGTLNWEINDAEQIYFQGKYNMWVMKYGKKLIGVNPKTGETTKEFSLDKFSYFTENANNDLGFVGYMATKDGHIFAVQEK